MKDYYQIDAVSASLLKRVIKQSPLHAEESMKPSEGTPAMRMGTAFHASVLEVENWEELIAVSPAVDRRTKAGKAEYAEFAETSVGKTIITPDQDFAIQQMKENILLHPEAFDLLEDCTATEFQTTFEFDGMDCKAMIDLCGENVIVDLKTTQDASPDAFMKSSANWLYHMQLAWYANAMGMELDEVDAYIIAVENVAPYQVAVYRFSADALDQGFKLCMDGMKKWKQYKLQKSVGNKVLAYGSDVKDLDLPAWARRD